jgi:ABC-2 type transport system permease protein
MGKTLVLFKRELSSYFTTPVAYVFIFFYLVLLGGLTFYFADFFHDGRGQADLRPFFAWHPWLYLFLVPAIAMRLWAEERKSGTIELLMTLPVTIAEAVVSKFLAAWVFVGIALALTFPVVWTVNFLGDPDNGVIAASYLGSWLMAGAYLAIGACISALTKNQVIAFVISVFLSFALILAGFSAVTDFVDIFASEAVVDAVRSLSFKTHFDSITKGVLDARDLLSFLSVMVCFLIANALVVQTTKAE